MKNSKSLIAVLIAFVLICTLAACAEKENTQNVTQAVTNENGELVTDENGEVVTEELEAVIVTDKNGKAVTEVVTNAEGKPLTTVVNKEYVNVTQYVTKKNGNALTNANNKASSNNTTNKKSSTTKKKGSSVSKPETPKKVSKLNASDIKETSLKLSWGSVKCDGYQIQISEDGVSYTYLEKNYKKTSYTVNNLTSFTEYYFRVRAFNKNDAGTSVSKWTEVKTKTKENDTSRYITIRVDLPFDNSKEDTLVIQINDDMVEKTVKCNGDVFEYKTDKKYKGAVTITASLKNTGSAFTVKTDKQSILIDLTTQGIYVIEGEDD